MKVHAYSFLALCTLGSCNLAPKYLAPKQKLPAEFKTSGIWRTAKPADHEDRGNWWKAFGDTHLNDLIQRAKAANPTLEQAMHRSEEAKSLARADRAGLFPSLGSSGSSRRARNSGAVAINFGGGRTITRNRLTLDLDYELDLWGRVRNTAAASSASAEAAQADYRSAMLSLETEVAMTYFALQAQDEAIALLKRTLTDRQKALTMAQTRFKQGDTAMLDVAQAETDLAATQAEALGLGKERAELEHALAALLGNTPSAFSLPSLQLGSTPPSFPSSLPADLLQRRPDIAAAERQMAAMNAEIGIAKAALFPSIALGGTGGTESSLVQNLATQAARVWGIGPELQWDILSAGRNKARIAAAQARYDERTAAYRATVLQAVREVEDARSTLLVYRDQLAALRTTVSAAQKTLDLAQKRYDGGLVAYYEVLDARRTLLRAERDLTALRGENYLAGVLLVKAVGGSW